MISSSDSLSSSKTWKASTFLYSCSFTSWIQKAILLLRHLLVKRVFDTKLYGIWTVFLGALIHIYSHSQLRLKGQQQFFKTLLVDGLIEPDYGCISEPLQRLFPWFSKDAPTGTSGNIVLGSGLDSIKNRLIISVKSAVSFKVTQLVHKNTKLCHR